MKTFADAAAWCAYVERELGDAAASVCQLFFRWSEDLRAAAQAEDLACGMHQGAPALLLTPEFVLPLPLVTGGPSIDDRGVAEYGVLRVAPGVWAVTPSLNAEGIVHAFVVLYDVPDPPPWERRIVLARGAFP